MRVARRFVISGRVQGVGFRWFVHDAASREGVTGWVTNLFDGRVEAFVEGEHGLLVPPGDAPALADAMRTLLGDAALRQRLGAAGRERVCQNFSRARLAREVRELYCRLRAPK